MYFFYEVVRLNDVSRVVGLHLSFDLILFLRLDCVAKSRVKTINVQIEKNRRFEVMFITKKNET